MSVPIPRDRIFLGGPKDGHVMIVPQDKTSVVFGNWPADPDDHSDFVYQLVTFAEKKTKTVLQVFIPAGDNGDQYLKRAKQLVTERPDLLEPTTP